MNKQFLIAFSILFTTQIAASNALKDIYRLQQGPLILNATDTQLSLKQTEESPTPEELDAVDAMHLKIRPANHKHPLFNHPFKTDQTQQLDHSTPTIISFIFRGAFNNETTNTYEVKDARCTIVIPTTGSAKKRFGLMEVKVQRINNAVAITVTGAQTGALLQFMQIPVFKTRPEGL